MSRNGRKEGDLISVFIIKRNEEVSRNVEEQNEVNYQIKLAESCDIVQFVLVI